MSAERLRTDSLEYDLPDARIATAPAPDRVSARLLVTRRDDPRPLADATVEQLPSHLRAGDLLVRNRTSVLPARLHGARSDTGGAMEGLYLGTRETEPGTLEWLAMVKMRRMGPGVRVALHAGGEPAGVEMELIERTSPNGGAWRVNVHRTGPYVDADSQTILRAMGTTPLPPYILGARKREGLQIEEGDDRAAYQTTFAREDESGSVAAPTAGLHFTPALDDAIRAKGVEIAEVTLHVGAGTFKPIDAEHVDEHPMHEEWCSVPPETADAIARTRAAGGRVIAVGTTTARTLESFGSVPALGTDEAAAGRRTDILITPGHTWSVVDGLLTNFHLPRSTLLAMVGAMFDGGVPALLGLYTHAIDERYRFYSYGDAMLVLPSESGR